MSVVTQMLIDWDIEAKAAVCAYCGDASPCRVLPFYRGKNACLKCFKALTS